VKVALRHVPAGSLYRSGDVGKTVGAHPLAPPGRRGPRAALAVALLLAGGLLPLLAVPATAIGTTVDVTVTPPRAIGTPSKGQPGPANLTADAYVFGSSTQGTLVFMVTTTQGWEARPASKTEQVPSGGGQFRFEFQVMVPPDVESGNTTGVEVRAEYRVGPATVAVGVGGASVEAGRYHGATVQRITPPEKMSPGQTYQIEYNIVNEGNAGSTMTFSWTDPELNSRLKADFIAPTTLSITGLRNATAVFRVTPQGTTPAGSYEVPVQMTITDRTGQGYGTVNFTVEMEFDNLPIYPGILPRLDLGGVETFLGFVGLFLTLWFLFNAAIAFAKRKDFEDEEGSAFMLALGARLSSTLLWRGVKRAAGGGRRKRARRAQI
jgi:hypothetical protein